MQHTKPHIWSYIIYISYLQGVQWDTDSGSTKTYRCLNCKRAFRKPCAHCKRAYSSERANVIWSILVPMASCGPRQYAPKISHWYDPPVLSYDQQKIFIMMIMIIKKRPFPRQCDASVVTTDDVMTWQPVHNLPEGFPLISECKKAAFSRHNCRLWQALGIPFLEVVDRLRALLPICGKMSITKRNYHLLAFYINNKVKGDICPWNTGKCAVELQKGL